MEEYLALGGQARVRHEFVAGEICDRQGSTVAHNRVLTKFFRLQPGVRARNGCRLLMIDVKLQVAPDVICYPDAMLVCDPLDCFTLMMVRTGECVVGGSRIVVEVLSDDTRTTNLREKLMFYRQVNSLDIYLIVEQNERTAYRHWRDDEGLWRSETVTGERAIPTPCLGIDLKLDDIYGNLTEIPAAT